MTNSPATAVRWWSAGWLPVVVVGPALRNAAGAKVCGVSPVSGEDACRGGEREHLWGVGLCGVGLGRICLPGVGGFCRNAFAGPGPGPGSVVAVVVPGSEKVD